MPPYVPRKRRSPAPEGPPPKRRETESGKKTATPKASLFDAVDAPKATATADEAKAFLATMGGSDDEDDDDDESSLSDEFEDVPMHNKDKDADEGDDMDWEDAIQPSNVINDDDDSAIQDVNISLNEDGSLQAIRAQQERTKKGPSKRERQTRIRTHCIHVQTLLFHNAVRNSWLNDADLHKTLLDGLSQGVKDEVDRWKNQMGMKKPPEPKKKKGKARDKRQTRDWGHDADRLEPGVPNLSSGDPLLRLLKVLTAYWRKRFTVAAPGVRKQGYKPLGQLTDDIKAWSKNKSDFEQHGERLESISDFRKCAKDCRGSRDVGAQLFTALIRALGIEARMVASLQPAGFGWTKAEDAEIKKPSPSNAPLVPPSDDESDAAESTPKSKTKAKSKAKPKAKKPLKTEKPARKSGRTSKAIVIDGDDESSSLSSVPSDNDDDASVIELSPPPRPSKNTKKYDRDLAFPHYWTEVLSPVSNNYIPVDSIVLSTVATNQDLLSTFEPRGKRADQAKQVICYVVAHNSDATAKDVTVRYLKKHQLPGRTKGFRMSAEKIPILNKRGKVIKYEEYDFFKRIMSPFERPHKKRTAADDLEESTDLKPFKPATEKPKAETESLQWYKQSAEFALERHLRREEAILPNAKPVKQFTAGKGEKAKTEPVYNRSDIVSCKTVESWHKEGRQVKFGEQPMKMVPVRAVTLVRKREMEEAERETGEKLKQGLYSIDQTEWIIPPPIENGHIPKNAFGNIDVYVPSMVPKGAVHIPLRSTARICRKLDIEYAEACTGFEFGKQRAVPVITGVVVAAEHEDAVIDAWEIEEAERKRKEDIKREALNLGLWRKFLMGMRIIERLRTDYADKADGGGEDVNPFVKREEQRKVKNEPRDEMAEGGGFLLPEDEEDTHRENKADGADDMELELGGGFVPDDEDEEKEVKSSHFAPMSLQSAHRQAAHDAEEDGSAEEEEEEEEEPDVPVQTKRRTAPTAKAKPTPRAKPTPKVKSTLKSTPKAAVKAKAKPTPKKQTPARKSKKIVDSESESETESEDEQEEDGVPDLSSSSELSELEELSDIPVASTNSTRPARGTGGGRGENGASRGRGRKTIASVVISPRKKGAGIRSVKAGWKEKEKEKEKEVRSPYFSSKKDELEDEGNIDEDEEMEDGEDIDEDEEMEDGDEDDGDESEEVIKPRATTARTRGRR